MKQDEENVPREGINGEKIGEVIRWKCLNCGDTFIEAYNEEKGTAHLISDCECGEKVSEVRR